MVRVISYPEHMDTKEGVMSKSEILSRARVGIDAPQVLVEVHLSGGLPSFSGPRVVDHVGGLVDIANISV